MVPSDISKGEAFFVSAISGKSSLVDGRLVAKTFVVNRGLVVHLFHDESRRSGSAETSEDDEVNGVPGMQRDACPLLLL
jgi:hypothetical protein